MRILLDRGMTMPAINLSPHSVSNMMNLLATVAGLGLNAKVHLFVAWDGTPNPGPLNFTEPNYTGYAPQTAVWDVPRNYPDGGYGNVARMVFNGQENISAGNTVTSSVIGWYMLDSSGLFMVAWGLFTTPTVLGGTGTQLPFDIDLEQYTIGTSYGNTIQA